MSVERRDCTITTYGRESDDGAFEWNDNPYPRARDVNDMRMSTGPSHRKTRKKLSTEGRPCVLINLFTSRKVAVGNLRIESTP